MSVPYKFAKSVDKVPTRTMEAEVRGILEPAVKFEKPIRLGDALASLGRKLGFTGEDIATPEALRGRAPAKPLELERPSSTNASPTPGEA
jgi:plasmid stability protein